MSDTSDSASEASSSTINHEHCPFHDDPRDGLCGATTATTKALCKYKAKHFLDGYHPVCSKHYTLHHNHRKSILRAGKCQAIEECGQLCNRLAKYAKPYHFCEKHQDGSNTLPCHLLRLPTELRLMVFRHLFPKVVASRKDGRIKTAILKTNRQINEEASSVLYGESHFSAFIRPYEIQIQGKAWRVKPATQTKRGRQYGDNFFIVDNLSDSSAHMIQNLDVTVYVGGGYWCPSDITFPGNSWNHPGRLCSALL
jgi:hypothetical protein